MQISITVKEILGASKLKARARLYLHDSTTGLSIDIQGLRIIDDGIKPPWIAMPQEGYWKGETMQYNDIIELNSIGKEKVFSSILKEYKKLKS